MKAINTIVLSIFATGNVQALFGGGNYGGDMGNWVSDIMNNGMQGGNFWNGGNQNQNMDQGNYWQGGNQNQNMDQGNYPGNNNNNNNNSGNYPGNNNNSGNYPGQDQNQGQYPGGDQSQGQQPQQPEQPSQNQGQSPSGGKCSAPVPNSDPCSKSSAQNQGQFSSRMNQPNPSGQCTEWADARYKELFGVNGDLNGDARLWVSDARRKGGYQISAQPSVGAMLITQPGTFGAGSTGHVGIVEKVYQDGQVCVSNWNFPTPWKTTYIKQKGQGQGVDYIQKNGVQLKC
jgi:surface antigen